MAHIYDISRTISPSLAVWPGDAPFSAEQILSKKAGYAVNLFRLALGAHTGSHIDAPYHFDDAGVHPADLSLDPYIGLARVATVSRRQGGIVPQDFEGRDLSEVRRLLIHTWVSELDDDRWAEGFPYPTVELADWLAERGVVLLGVDMPSVDRQDDDQLVCHHRLYQHGIANLENLTLVGVPDGVYELIALPLKIAGVCGSPVRAILRSI